MFATLEALNKTLVITDVAGRRDVLAQRLDYPHGLHSLQRSRPHPQRLRPRRRLGRPPGRVVRARAAHGVCLYPPERCAPRAIWAQHFLARVRELTGVVVPPPPAAAAAGAGAACLGQLSIISHQLSVVPLTYLARSTADG
ncbi:MAG: hypothetical protein WKG07_14465 [Hymenobacter sp.]